MLLQGASTKTKQRLGPSKPLLDAIKLLEKAEGSVQSETIELHRDGGVFHVYANLNKVPTKMVFDTGAGLTTISAKLAQDLTFNLSAGSPGFLALFDYNGDGTIDGLDFFQFRARFGVTLLP